jgi:hypothetical protein
MRYRFPNEPIKLKSQYEAANKWAAMRMYTI